MKCRSFFCPEGATENSPAIHCRDGCFYLVLVPTLYTEMQRINHSHHLIIIITVQKGAEISLNCDFRMIPVIGMIISMNNHGNQINHTGITVQKGWEIIGVTRLTI